MLCFPEQFAHVVRSKSIVVGNAFGVDGRGRWTPTQLANSAPMSSVRSRSCATEGQPTTVLRSSGNSVKGFRMRIDTNHRLSRTTLTLR